MTNELFTLIFRGILTIIGFVIVYVLIPYIKSKMTKTELEKLDFYVNLAVRSANQIFTPEQFESKKAYVTAYITDVINTKLHLTLTPEDIDVMIEGVVNSVKNLW